jgi:hypothetical protein
LFEFQATKFNQNSIYLSHLISSEIYEIKSIKSDLLKAFQQHQERPQIPMQFSILILFNFHEKNGSIISIFHTVASKSLKPIRCTYSSRAFLIYQEYRMKHRGLGDLTMTNKTKLPCFIDK